MAVLRTGLLLLFVVGVVGTLAELLLLEHWKEWTQWAPLAILVVALLVVGGWGVIRSPALLLLFRGWMWLFLVVGVVGVLLHYRGNVEWELETDATIRGWALFKAAVTGATPALAPGTMVQLGLVGLAYTFRHPALAGRGHAQGGMRMIRNQFSTTAALLVAIATSPLAAQVGKRLTIVDPNQASEAELQRVANLTPVLVSDIIGRRPWLSQTELNAYLATVLKPEQLVETYKGLFLQLNLNSTSREEILMIPGAGNRWLREFMEYRPYQALAVFHREMSKYAKEDEVNRLEQYVFVPLDLNSASDSAFMTIPGVGKKMAYEFQEYRPWKSMEQFRREIGKYVKPTEVARLERYVMLPAATP